MRYILPLLLVTGFGSNAHAALIPYYRMDSLAFLSSDIVLCEEVKYEKKQDGGWVEATFTVVEVLKGSCKPKERIFVQLDPVYTRRLTSQAFGATADELPLGRAVLFLNKAKVDAPDGGREVWQPATGGVKLFIKGETYCYGQFLSNPGPLWLARMAPENIEVPPALPYTETLFLMDLRAVLVKAKELKEATRGYATKDVVREAPKDK